MKRLSETVRDELADQGRIVDIRPAWSPGRMCAAGLTPGGLVRAAATPRYMRAYAVGR